MLFWKKKKKIGQDSCDGHNHLNNEWNKPKFVEWDSINLRDVVS